MKGSTQVRAMRGLIRYLVGIKNRQVRAERQHSRALEESCRILSAYVALLAESRGEIRLSAKDVGRAIGDSEAIVTRVGGDYVIRIKRKSDIGNDGFDEESVECDSIGVSFADEGSAVKENGGAYVV